MTLHTPHLTIALHILSLYWMSMDREKKWSPIFKKIPKLWLRDLCIRDRANHLPFLIAIGCLPSAYEQLGNFQKRGQF